MLQVRELLHASQSLFLTCSLQSNIEPSIMTTHVEGREYDVIFAGYVWR